MTEKIAVINDLSGFGRCSLTAAIPVISAMGVQPCPLPTAILSAQTGYDSYYYDDYTEKMEKFTEEWRKLQASFDGIYTGFMAHSGQVRSVFRFLECFCKEGTFLLVDPILGDGGKKFGFSNDELCMMMRELAVRADVITPNLTELCILTGEDYREFEGMKNKQSLFKAVGEVGTLFAESGPSEIVVTGIRFTDEEDGMEKMANLVISPEGTSTAVFPFIGESFSGTGDLFASVVAGGKARGEKLKNVVKLAGKMIELSIRESVREGISRNEGVSFEKYLWMLTEWAKKIDVN